MRLILFTAAVALVLGPFGASADQTRTVPEGYKYMGPDRADSTCIGEISTPECMVETYRACYVRADPSLCALAGLQGVTFRYEKASFYYVYRIVDVVYAPSDWTLFMLEDEPWFDRSLAEARIKTTYCSIGEDCPVGKNQSFSRMVMFLERGEAGWQLKRWAWDEGLAICENEDSTRADYSLECGLLVDNYGLPWINEYD